MAKNLNFLLLGEIKAHLGNATNHTVSFNKLWCEYLNNKTMMKFEDPFL